MRAMQLTRANKGPGRGIALPVLGRSVSAPVAAPEAALARRGGTLIDSHGRTIRDLRISLTDRCNFRCVYCMEPDVRFKNPDELLTTDEVVRLARIAASLGVRKIRLTGGEPTLRPDLERIIAGIRATASVEIAITTNGVLIDRARARSWKHAGLDRVTLSLDSLDEKRFARITRSTAAPGDVLAAAQACIDAGLTPVKINAVLVRGCNEDEAPALAGIAREMGVEVRFIEFMPLDSGRHWDPSLVVTAEEVLRAINERFPLTPTNEDGASSTATTYRFADGAPGLIGIVAPVSRPFCGACSRLRITADAKVRPCLFSREEWDLMPLLRGGAEDPDVAEFLHNVTWTKQKGHGISKPGFTPPERPMSAIGG